MEEDQVKAVSIESAVETFKQQQLYFKKVGIEINSDEILKLAFSLIWDLAYELGRQEGFEDG